MRKDQRVHKDHRFRRPKSAKTVDSEDRRFRRPKSAKTEECEDRRFRRP